MCSLRSSRTLVGTCGRPCPLPPSGTVSVGDEGVLCSGNWTGSHAAIKTLVFRENNVIVLMVYEATENMNLSDEAVIELATKQDAKLLS